MSTGVDPAFEGAGKQAGIEIWRIENFEAVPYPASNYGKFHQGDCYILLFTKEIAGSLSWEIHFWIGKDAAQDEYGTAAIKAVELDHALGGMPSIHREVMEYESDLFLSYFKSKGGVRYLPGGVASGFKHVDPDAVEKRLFQVKGKRNVRVRQVPLDINSMNKGDCFILDLGKVIYVYIGRESKRVERLRANMAAKQIRDQDHGGRSKVIILDETGEDETTFFAEVGGGTRSDVKPASAAEDDVEFEKKSMAVASLFRVCDHEGGIKSEKVGEKPFKQDMLKSEDCFVLDTVTAGLFVWNGKSASKTEKVQALHLAEKFLVEHNYPKWTKIQRVIDGGEPTIFKQYFSMWKEPDDQVSLGKVYTKERIAASMEAGEPVEFHVDMLHRKKLRQLAKSGGKAFGFMPDDGNGKTEVFRVENFELAPIDPTTNGMFFGGDSYVIRYTYQQGGREKYVLYFWQGTDSTQDEKAASALQTIRLDDELGGKAIQVRVVQGFEPRHFLKMFKGHMIVFMGGHASGFRNLHDHDTYDPNGTHMFRVSATCPEDVRAVQVVAKAASLNSEDVFVLDTPTVTYIWQGEASSEDEQQYSPQVAARVSPDREVKLIPEGQETPEFWAALGGQGEYEKAQNLLEDPTLQPRLFHCYINQAGRFMVEEEHHFTQDDLEEDDSMMLDTGEEIYVWIGNGTTAEEKQKTLELAEEYVQKDPSERRGDQSILIRVKQGEEPSAFKALFPSWNPNMWAEQMTYEDMKRELEEENDAVEDD